MLITKKIEEAINKQINAEMFSSYLYLSMAAYFDSVNLTGFAHWFKKQAGEENEHAVKFYNFVYERGGKVTLEAIAAPKTEFKSALEIAEETYKHELKVTDLIHKLVYLARDEKDLATENFLQWYVKEQVEEEANSLLLIEKLKFIGENGPALIMLDRELAAR